MSRRKQPGARAISGIVIVDKPAGQTSNRTLQHTKRLFSAEKAGHTGTLDPIATGMLPICFGSATRISGLMLAASKRYRVTARFGIATDTGDASGSVTATDSTQPPAAAALQRALGGLTGRIQQVPPMYSALKQRGRRLYELAREGKEVPRPPRSVEIHALEIEQLVWPDLELSVHCSKGTYVRSLVTDLASAIGTVAHVTALRRLGVGPFQASQMVSLETLEDAAREGTDALDRWLLGTDAALIDRPPVTVSEADGMALRQGRRIPFSGNRPAQSVRVYEAGGRFVGLGDFTDGGELKPARIFPA